MRTFVAIVLVLVGLPALAFAKKGAPAPATEHKPLLYLDEASFGMRLLSREDGGYGFVATVNVYGLSSANDLLRLDFKQKGKVLKSAKCIGSFEVGFASAECRHPADDGQLIQAKGDIEADLIYWDDREEKEYLVRTFKTTVGAWKEGKKTMYQIMPDDLLASAYLFHGGAEANNSTYRLPVLYFWTASNASMPRMVFRCSVDGKKLDQDFEMSGSSGADGIEHIYDPPKGERQVYVWAQQVVDFNAYWGPKDTLKDYAQTSGRVMADHPGKWDCQLRTEGRAIRRFLFTVDKDGYVQHADFQFGKGGIPTAPGTVLIDVRIPEDAKWDNRIRPDAMKKGMGFGLPWPEHDTVKEIHKSFPAKSGLPDP